MILPPDEVLFFQTTEDFNLPDEIDTLPLYMKEVSKIPLLTADEEIILAKTMEKGRTAENKLNRLKDTESEEKESLIYQSRKGEEAQKKLIQANTRLVISMAKKHMDEGVPFLDLIQEGNVGLMRAVEKFEWRRGNKFSTYATWWIRQAISRALADQGRTIRVPVHVNNKIRRIYAVAMRLEAELGRRPNITEISMASKLDRQTVIDGFKKSKTTLSLDMPVGEDRMNELGDFIESDEPEMDEAIKRPMLNRDMQNLFGCLTSREERVLRLRYGFVDGQTHTLKEVSRKFGVTRERVRQIEQEALKKLRIPERRARFKDYIT